VKAGLIASVTKEPHGRTFLVFHHFFQKHSLKRTAEIDQCRERNINLKIKR
jgi:hypothetical protein